MLIADDILTALYITLLGANTGATVFDNFGPSSKNAEKILVRKWIYQHNAQKIAEEITKAFDPQYLQYYSKISNLISKYTALEKFEQRLSEDKHKDGITKGFRCIDNAISWNVDLRHHHSKIALANIRDELIVEHDFSIFFDKVPENFRLNEFIDLQNLNLGLISPNRTYDRKTLTTLCQLPQYILPNYREFEKGWVYHFNELISCHRTIVEGVQSRFEFQLDAKSIKENKNIQSTIYEKLSENRLLLKETEQKVLHHLAHVSGLIQDRTSTLFKIPNKVNNDIILQNYSGMIDKLNFDEYAVNRIKKLLKSEEKNISSYKEKPTLLSNILRLTALNSFVNIHKRQKDDLKKKIDTYMSLAHIELDEVDTILYRASELYSKIKPRGFRKAFLKAIKKLKNGLPKSNVHRGVMEFSDTPSILTEKVLHKHLDVAIKEQKQNKTDYHTSEPGKRVQQRIEKLSSMLDKNTLHDKKKNLEEGIQMQTNNFKQMMQNINQLEPNSANSTLLANAITLQEQLLAGEIESHEYIEKVSQVFSQFQSGIKNNGDLNPSQYKNDTTS